MGTPLKFPDNCFHFTTYISEQGKRRSQRQRKRDNFNLAGSRTGHSPLFKIGY